ncbi:tyrosine-type recombinase/integrase [Nonomuraea deserti]|uniref:tyrosine-type recombinase/integrase n=1 Tax=Nonomuraea deserti TaxID=1848322 RepID=UPI001C7035F3
MDLRLDDEHVRVHGKGGSVRTVLLDDRGYVTLPQLYLARAGYTAGPLFRAAINGRGGPLSYDAAHHRWQAYCSQAGVEIDIYQLRHAHATELINAGVSIEAVRRRLGHASAETTQLYELLGDKAAAAVLVQREVETAEREPEPGEAGDQARPDRVGHVEGSVGERVPVGAAPVDRPAGGGDLAGEHARSRQRHAGVAGLGHLRLEQTGGHV